MSAGEDIRKERIKKLEKLAENKINPYPAKVAFALTEIAGAKVNFKKLASKKPKPMGIAGRVLAKRGHGGIMFLDIFDSSNSLGGSTAKLQVLAAEDKMGKENYSLLQETIDVGDFIAVWGKPFYTKRKEPTIEAEKWQMLSKSLRPLPEKWHGLQDVEERFRKRYLDILMNPEVRSRFALRSRLVQELRTLLDKEGYMEVETPILQPIYGGALAEPFKTHHRMLDMEMYLRIAPELYLKRLLTAGFTKIYEIGRNFRNEGLDATHNPEFTTIELYEAYRDAEYLKKFIVKILSELTKKVTGKTAFKYNGNVIKMGLKIPEVPFWRVIERYGGISAPEKLPQKDLLLYARRFGVACGETDPKVKLADLIFKKVVRPKIIQPTFVVDYPIEMSPLAKNLSGNADIVDRFQLIIGGVEIMNGFSELNDPQEQRKRLEEQDKMRKGTDKEAHPLDEEFIEMMEYGMPPASGLGMSIDRLTMLLSDTDNIKEVIIFPTMKPKM